MLMVKQKKDDEAWDTINSARVLLDPRLSALVGESYDRAYPMAVTAQQLVELEEIVDFHRKGRPLERRQTLKQLWVDRLDGVQRSARVWERLLAGNAT